MYVQIKRSKLVLNFPQEFVSYKDSFFIFEFLLFQILLLKMCHASRKKNKIIQ